MSLLSLNLSRVAGPRTRRFAAACLVAGIGLSLVPGQANAVVVPPSVAGTITSANPVDNTPHAQNGETRAFAEIGNTVYVGGTFTSVKNAGAASWTAKSYLFAYDRTTGAISTTFVPVLDGGVNALEVSPDGKLIVGGAFGTVNGVERRQLVELEPTTGATVAAWVGRSDGGNIKAMAVRGNFLYVGGAFQWINGTSHSRLARLNATTGAIDPTFQIDIAGTRNATATPLVWTMDVSPDGKTLVAGGNFLTVNGASRNQIVMVEGLLGTPAVASWATTRYTPACFSASFVYYVQSVDFSDDSSYFIVGSNGGREAGAYCDAIARFETSARGTAVDGTWLDETGVDTVTAVEATSGVIYVGGHFRWLNNANGADSKGAGGIDRLGMGALDPTNGLPMSWNPRRSGAPVGLTEWGSAVPVLWKGAQGVYFGQNSDGMGEEYHGRLGMFPTAGGRTIPVTNPVSPAGYLHRANAAKQTRRFQYNGTTFGPNNLVSQPNLAIGGPAMGADNKLFWGSGAVFNFSTITTGTIGVPWTNTYNSWFNPSTMTGATYRDGRMYYTKNGSNVLYYRYFEPDGYIVGCTEFTIPTTGITWGTVRGLALAGNQLMFGSTDGSLRSVTFDATAGTGGFAANGATAILHAPAGQLFNTPTLFFAPA